MKLDALVVQVEAWAQEELAAQERLERLLREQTEAVVASDTERLLKSAEAVERELAGRPARERRRTKLVAAFAAAFGVAPGTLTLTSISERARAAGVDVSRLDAARARVRTAAAEALRAGRKLAVLARYHQGLFQEVLRTIGASSGAEVEEGRGSWVHVEA